jgi:hypothetical protein
VRTDTGVEFWHHSLFGDDDGLHLRASAASERMRALVEAGSAARVPQQVAEELLAAAAGLAKLCHQLSPEAVMRAERAIAAVAEYCEREDD